MPGNSGSTTPSRSTWPGSKSRTRTQIQQPGALALAGEIVAAVSGEPYARYVERHILDPLALTSTRVRPDAALLNLATAYGPRVPGAAREILPFADCRGLAPAANLASTVQDLAK